MSNKDIIEDLLKKNPHGLSIQELSSSTKLNRQAVVAILAEIKGEKKIKVRPIGQVKLHYWKFN